MTAEVEFRSCLGMPIEQTNAHLSDGLTMRVGIPHCGGRLSFTAFEEGFPVMVSASAFWHQPSNSFKIPEATNLTELDLALDSAGYTAMKLWKEKGAQRGMASMFPWQYGDYCELAALMSVNWWAAPDACCEPEISTSQAEIDYRIDVTATLLEGTLRVVYEWQDQLARDATVSARTIANMIKPPTPIVQGWKTSDYRRSLELLLQVWQRWQPWLATPALIGVGSVCRRHLHHPEHGLYAILAALEGNLPKGSRLHLFGIKGSALEELRHHPYVASADSMAWDVGARMSALKGGHSNTMEHRSTEMKQWMRAALERAQHKASDQLRLSFFS